MCRHQLKWMAPIWAETRSPTVIRSPNGRDWCAGSASIDESVVELFCLLPEYQSPSYAILFFGDHFVVRSLTCDDVYSCAAVSIDVCGALNPNSGKSGVCAMRRWRAPRKVCCSSNYLNWSWWLINRFHFTSINILGGINNNNSTSWTRKLAHSVTLRNGT